MLNSTNNTLNYVGHSIYGSFELAAMKSQVGFKNKNRKPYKTKHYLCDPIHYNMLNFPCINFTTIVFTFAICSYTDNTHDEEEQPDEQQEHQQHQQEEQQQT